MKDVQFRILLIEDNTDHAELVKQAISRAKRGAYSVEWVMTVEKAIELLEHDVFNVIVSDYSLPGQTGLDLLDWLNKKEKTTPFIMLTGSGDEKVAVRAMKEGAYNYVVKDDVYTEIITHVIDEALLKYLSVQEKIHLEHEIREKNVALEKANRQLKKLDQLKSDFISNVSHEIRTPLNSVKEGISLILDGIVNPRDEKGARVLEIAKRNIERLTAMINDLLDFSKIEAGKLRIHLEPCNIQVLIDEVTIAFRSLAQIRKVKLEFTPVADFPKAFADGERLVQVMTNLVNNALKFTPEGGTVSFACEIAPDEMIKVSVKDTGMGIPKDDLSRIFERFEQSDHTTLTKGTRGTGLGLSICREIVRMHRGEIWAESEVGKGSRFSFTVPLNQMSFERHAPRSAAAKERVLE